MKIPPEIQINATLYPGSVFYFVEEMLTSDEPHYFVTLNRKPTSDVLLLMVCSTSKLDKVRLRNIHNNPDDTLIEVSPLQYSEFSKTSIFDCNSVFLKTTENLVSKLNEGKLKIKSKMPDDILIKLRSAVKASPAVAASQKRILL